MNTAALDRANRIVFIVNPIAGGGKRRDISAEITDAAETAGANLEDIIIFETKTAGEAVEIARNLAIDNNYLELLVVAVGGDGTVNEVARGLLEAQKVQTEANIDANIETNNNTALGIIPKGSGNGLARHLGIKPFNKRNLATSALIDHATINGKPFFCTAGIGFDALVSKKYAENNAHKRGALKYIRTAIKSYFSYKPEKYLITINGKVYERTAFLITFANASQWGNNGYIAPMADISDGLIDVAIVKKFPITAIPRLIYQLMTQKLHKSPYVEYFKCEILEVTPLESRVTPKTQNSRRASAEMRNLELPIVAHIDGEPITLHNKIEVKVYKQSLKVVI